MTNSTPNRSTITSAANQLDGSRSDKTNVSLIDFHRSRPFVTPSFSSSSSPSYSHAFSLHPKLSLATSLFSFLLFLYLIASLVSASSSSPPLLQPNVVNFAHNVSISYSSSPSSITLQSSKTASQEQRLNKSNKVKQHSSLSQSPSSPKPSTVNVADSDLSPNQRIVPNSKSANPRTTNPLSTLTSPSLAPNRKSKAKYYEFDENNLYQTSLVSSALSSPVYTSSLRPKLGSPLVIRSMFTNDTSCQSNCSGHGDCYNGTCFCEVEYSGGSCKDPNFKYYISFSTVYYMICVVSFIQLMLCINSEIARQKPRSITRAFRINIQKALYIFICLGTAIRGFYFSSPANSTIRWAESLMSAYYPILMSGSSLLVCFWAEVFHLDVSVERSRFLSKSFTGFILFNIVTYSLLLAELVLLTFANPTDTDKGFFLSIFNSIYAFLMLVVVVFFLIYGVEVYFKVRGAFIQEESCPADVSQLQQSRLGLVSQAVLLLVTILFMISEVFGFLWKDKVPVLSRNYHQVMFRVVEFGVALWFPCVLWNCIQPERLWILNPRRILKRQPNFFQIDDNRKTMFGKSLAESELLVGGSVGSQPGSSKSMIASFPECWICYESPETKPEAGPLIQPCACRGDVSAVHHECLLRWLMESYSTPNCPVYCKVCGTPYRVEHTSETVWLPAGLTITHWFKTAAIVTIMCTTLAGSCMIVKLFEHMYVKTISVGSAILVEYICLRLLGFNMISAYHRAKFSAIKIIGKKITDHNELQVEHNHNNQRVASQSSSQPLTGESISNLPSGKKRLCQTPCGKVPLKSDKGINYDKSQSSCDIGKSSQIDANDHIQDRTEEKVPLRTLSESIEDNQICSSVSCSAEVNSQLDAVCDE